jgi:Kef-type K+ transport system membrane component KefB
VQAEQVVRLGQPQVVAEMLAGILLGPSLFGRFFPDYFQMLFNDQALSQLSGIASVAVCIFPSVENPDFTRLFLITSGAGNPGA